MINPYKKMYALTEEQYKHYKMLLGDEPPPSASTTAPSDPLPAPNGSLPAPVDSLHAPADSLPAPNGSLPAPNGSSSAHVDSLPAPSGSKSKLSHKRRRHAHHNDPLPAPSSSLSKKRHIDPLPKALDTFECKTCGHKFKHKRNLNRHAKIHTTAKRYPNWLTL